MNKPRKTNFPRPLYRLGWLVIWSTWLATLCCYAGRFRGTTPSSAVVPGLLTEIAYFVQRLWDRSLPGRPLPRGGAGVEEAFCL
ncbi:MAG: hypothetical protein Ct9H300mP16_02810 [Pseudomonadota bacterium]|nr:MAG: hypothetical protein Ct9H300mP16_02810 [Pseudomonadota bacterium]